MLTVGAVVSARVHGEPGTRPRLDGAIHVRGIPGSLLLVRVRSGPGGITDAVYRLRGTTLARVRVGSGYGDGLMAGADASGFADFDCGAALRSVVQITAEPHGSLWRETVLTFTLRPAGFVLESVERRTVGLAQAAERRCPLVRLP